jgi:hypothetical protein
VQSLGVMGWTRARGEKRCDVWDRLTLGQHKAIGGGSETDEIAMSCLLEGGMALSMYCTLLLSSLAAFIR